MFRVDLLKVLFSTPDKRVVITDGYEAQRDASPVFGVLSVLLVICGIAVFASLI